MSKKRQQQQIERAKRRIEKIRRRIEAMELVCSGTLHTRTKVCGKSSCRCHQNPRHRHGPYHEWTRREDGRLRHSVFAPEQAEQIQEAIDNYREILGLLRRWEEETVRIIRAEI